MDVTYPRELIHLKAILFRKGFDISISKDRAPQDKASKKLLFVAIHCIGISLRFHSHIQRSYKFLCMDVFSLFCAQLNQDWLIKFVLRT